MYSREDREEHETEANASASTACMLVPVQTSEHELKLLIRYALVTPNGGLL